MSVNALANPIDVNTKSFSVKLGSSRVIFNETAPSESVSVNNLQDFPILVQSKVYAEDKKSDAPFIVTPPIFRLEPNQQSRVRIITSDNHFKSDRETLYWMCVKGVPPVDTSTKSSDGKSTSLNISVAVNSCNKLIYRPKGIAAFPVDIDKDIKWEYRNGSVIATNSTPHYINVSNIRVDGIDVAKPEYIAPFSSKSYPVHLSKAAGRVEWSAINDFGGVSRTYQFSLK